MTFQLHPVFRHVIGDYGWLEPCLVPGPDSAVLTVGELARPGTIDACLAAAAARFPMGNRRFEAQVWWFSAINSLVVPAVDAMVEYSAAASLDIGCGQLFVRHTSSGSGQAEQPYYWMGFTPRVDDGADGDDPAVWHRAGRELAASLGPLVECLCEHAGLRPGPLWAIVGDGLSGAAAAAGNHAFDPYRGVHVGLELNRGLADGVGGSVVLPPPRFIDVCDGVIRATDTAAAEKGVDSPDVHTAIRRNSCCMIYHNPSSDKCVSCPKKTPAEKDRDLLAYVSSMEP